MIKLVSFRKLSVDIVALDWLDAGDVCVAFGDWDLPLFFAISESSV